MWATSSATCHPPSRVGRRKSSGRSPPTRSAIRRHCAKAPARTTSYDGWRTGTSAEQAREGALVRLAQLRERHREDALHVERVAVHDADPAARDAARVAHLGEPKLLDRKSGV